MIGSPKPTSYESLMPSRVNPYLLLTRFRPHGLARRILLVAARSDERRLTQPRAAAQARPANPVLMPEAFLQLSTRAKRAPGPDIANPRRSSPAGNSVDLPKISKK